MERINRKKHREQRRKRPAKSVATARVIYIDTNSWSNSGVKYIRYKLVLTKI